MAITVALALASLAPGQQQNTPHIGYVYPAGGRQGATFQVVLGGESLNGATNVYVSGDGVRATVLEYNRPMTPKEFSELRDLLKALQEKRRASAQATGKGESPAGAQNLTNVWTVADERLFAEIRARMLKNPPNRQGNSAIAETVLVQVTLATNAEPGWRELRLGTPIGLSNPLVFRVGRLPEYSRPAAKPSTPELDRLRKQFSLQPQNPSARLELRITLPATVNGQIAPGGVDVYRFAARRGQQLVIAVSARELMPYLADAVPGWFEATLTLYDAKGSELAYDDRYRFHPDPVIHYEIPKDGEYLVAIKDSLYRGREDFVYRMSLGELPFVTSIFPLGGSAGSATTVELKGWNLPAKTFMQDDKDREPGIYSLAASNDQRLFNPVPFAVDTLPECLDQATSNSPDSAQSITLPSIINGRIDRPGDRDVFRFQGHAGEQVVAEVYARRLGSPLDSVLKLTDGAGRQLAFNDDYEDKGAGLETHHADSYLAATLPADGSYYLYLGDAQHQGGAEYGYRLRVSPPRPDFELRVVPSTLSVRAGLSVPFTAYVLRKDGFTNEIELALKDSPAEFSLSGGVIPANQDHVRLTLTAPSMPENEPVNLSLEGRARIQGREVVHRAVPADDMMQAFAYHHFVCAKELKVAVIGKGWPLARARIRILGEMPVKIPAGGTVAVLIATPGNAFADRFEFELSEPPDGIILQDVSRRGRGMEVVLRGDAGKAKPGLRGNLIIHLVPRMNQAGAPTAPQAGNQRRSPIGVLPAVPFEIVP
jgi:hypothetical protein